MFEWQAKTGCGGGRLTAAVRNAAWRGVWGSYGVETKDQGDQGEEQGEDEYDGVRAHKRRPLCSLFYSRPMLDVLIDCASFDSDNARRNRIMLQDARQLCDLCLELPIRREPGHWCLSNGSDLVREMQDELEVRDQLRAMFTGLMVVVFPPPLVNLIWLYMFMQPATDVRFRYYDDEEVCAEVRKGEATGTVPPPLCAIS